MTESIPTEILMRCYAEELDRRNARERRLDRETERCLRDAIRRLTWHKQEAAPAIVTNEPKPIRTVCEAVRRVIATKMNGHPVSKSFLMAEVSQLITCDSSSVNSALGVCRTDGLVQRGSRFGTWQKTKGERVVEHGSR